MASSKLQGTDGAQLRHRLAGLLDEGAQLPQTHPRSRALLFAAKNKYEKQYRQYTSKLKDDAIYISTESKKRYIRTHIYIYIQVARVPRLIQ